MLIAIRIMGLLVLLIVSCPISSSAKIADGIKCSECHTMHASQNDMPMGEDTPREGLLLLSCLGCHMGENPDNSGRFAPFVNSFTEPSYDLTGTESSANTLAGGTFYWSYNYPSSENKGHNVEPGLGPTPPIDIPGGGTLDSRLACAGTSGCHGSLGDENMYKAMSKSHHAADRDSFGETLIDGSSVGTSYRFLSGVQGLEDPDWELPSAGSGLSADKHNQYKGPPTWVNSETYTDTITWVCARCHGDFHGDDTGDGSSPWLRHPIDIDIADSKYDLTEFNNYSEYNPIAPVASSADPLVFVNTNVQSSGNGIVTCISCHRAHGSRWAYNLRWNYMAWPGGDNAYPGCSICHSSK